MRKCGHSRVKGTGTARKIGGNARPQSRAAYRFTTTVHHEMSMSTTKEIKK